MASVCVILYGYAPSPFTSKIENTLLLKGISYYKVKVPPVLPRTAISDLLGITYRRLPILAIGRDVYCDSSLITVALERQFPPSKRYGTIFPKPKHGGHTQTGLVKTLTQQVENTIIPLTVSLLPWDEFSESFIQDRASYYGSPVDTKSIIASRQEDLNTISSYLHLIEEQLADGREWLYYTEQAGLADISFSSIFSWAEGLAAFGGLITAQRFPNVTAWLKRFRALVDHISHRQVAPGELTGYQAAVMITTSSYQPLDTIGFDSNDASRISVKRDDIVSIVPTDTGGLHPTTGKLVALSKTESVIEVTGYKGVLRCHFPRLNFSLSSASTCLPRS
ncbi:hypothetical protein APHAL10511_002990 [Amanita phalloides]|nr:hypothetical protein APHAL10511_002990 [Amanita phalloides]